MSAPRIAPFYEVCHDQSLGLKNIKDFLSALEQHMFVVLKSGYAMGCWWKRGDVVVCSESSSRGTNVVLSPVGYGWPRLGHQTNYGELSGDAGEPCRSDRWRVVGEILYVMRQDAHSAWIKVNKREMLESPVTENVQFWEQPVEPSPVYAVQGWSHVADDAQKRCSQVRARQLSLFTRTAIAA